MSGAVLAKAVMRPFLVIADTSGFLFDFRPWYNKLFGISISTAAAVSSAAGVLWICRVAHHNRHLCGRGGTQVGCAVDTLFVAFFIIASVLGVYFGYAVYFHTRVCCLFWQRAAELQRACAL